MLLNHKFSQYGHTPIKGKVAWKICTVLITMKVLHYLFSYGDSKASLYLRVMRQKVLKITALQQRSEWTLTNDSFSPPAYKMLTYLLFYMTFKSYRLPGAKTQLLPISFAWICCYVHPYLEGSSAMTAAWNGSVSEIMKTGCNPHLCFRQHTYNFPATFFYNSQLKLLFLLVWKIPRSTKHWIKQGLLKAAPREGPHSGDCDTLSIPPSDYACTHMWSFTSAWMCLWVLCVEFQHVWLSMCVFISGQMLTFPGTEFGLSKEWSRSIGWICVCVCFTEYSTGTQWSPGCLTHGLFWHMHVHTHARVDDTSAYWRPQCTCPDRYAI